MDRMVSDLQRTITKMRFDASMMGQNASFDSDKKDNEGPLADTLSKINKAITFTPLMLKELLLKER